jgi:hypothetical protein
VDGSGSGLCPVAKFGVRNIKISDSATRDLVQQQQQQQQQKFFLI